MQIAKQRRKWRVEREKKIDVSSSKESRENLNNNQTKM